MVIFKIIKGKYKGISSIRNVINYILYPDKNPNGVFHAWGNTPSDVEYIVSKFVAIQKKYRNEKGKRIYHFVLSFDKHSTYSYEDYRHFGYLIADYFKEDYQLIFAFHEKDKNDCFKCPHIHFALNPISYRTGKRLRIDKKQLHDIRDYIKKNIDNQVQLDNDSNDLTGII